MSPFTIEVRVTVDQDVFWILLGFGFLAAAIIGLKIFVHTKASKMEAERAAAKKAENTDSASDS